MVGSTHFSQMYLNRIRERLDHWVDVFDDDYECKQFSDSLGCEFSDQLKALFRLFDNDVISIGEYCYLCSVAVEHAARIVVNHLSEGINV